jgi:hypothetical protein
MWDDLETTLEPVPEFFVQAPDKRKDWAEIDRQATFLKLCRQAAPRVMVRATANAGKRNPRLAKKEGIVAGTFDLVCHFRAPQVAYIEFKGYTKAGRAGVLSPQQIEFGNRMTAFGIPVACFFDPYDAFDWLQHQGFPCAAVSRAR